MPPIPPTSTLFPYTTLFRSPHRQIQRGARSQDEPIDLRRRGRTAATQPAAGRLAPPGRSEEHTSELQSRFDLVCRLLLEKKKNNIIYEVNKSINIYAYNYFY